MTAALTALWFIGVLLARLAAALTGIFCLFVLVVVAEAGLRRVRHFWTVRRR